MSKSLLIVESPTKARTLSRYLGKDFIVKSSVGHVKDLPKNKLGIDLNNQFQPEYQLIRGKKSIMKELSQAAGQVDTVYLGSDPDREGEAIAWHIAEEIEARGKPIHRVLFHELTKKAIQDALAHPRELNRSLFEAQQSRRTLDRLVGYLISPLLWQKVKRGLSAGRVQSVALRLICEREREIQKFEAEEYWSITAQLGTQPEAGAAAKKAERSTETFGARLWRCQKQKCKVGNEEEARRIVDTLRSCNFQVAKVERKAQRRHPVPPFITSTLQQEAARKLRFSAKRTMSVAQQLYEGVDLGQAGAVGLITYMRTDSTRLSDDSIQGVRDYINEIWGQPFVPPKPNYFKNRKNVQDAHEAVRPTDVNQTPEALARFLSKEQLALYTLVWKRFVACQMAPALIDQTTVDVSAGSFILRATGSVVRFPGFLVLYEEAQENGENGKEGEGRLPDLQQGQVLSLLDIIPKQHFTQPPARFSEASLIKELEERGIGRPSTYATILSTILNKEYVSQDKQRLHPTELGFIINDLLVDNFPGIVNAEFTAKMEESLDSIEEGQQSYVKLMGEFYKQFATTLESAKANMLNLKSVGLVTSLNCPKCQRPLAIRWSRNGPFISCSGYPDCDFASDYERDEKGQIRLLQDTVGEETCDKCGRAMALKRGRYGAFLACSGYPECKNTRPLPGDNAKAPPAAASQMTDQKCEKCGGQFMVKQSRYGIAFLACDNYPKCKNARPMPTGIPCPAKGCGGELVERAGRMGRFFGCSKYPECKTVLRGKPVREPCPLCAAPVMLQKESKRTGPKLVCPNPDCKYQQPVEQPPDPAQVEAH
jgi:DNA topoisomerase-1